MKKIVRLTESELNRIVEKTVRRAINEGAVNNYMINEGFKDKAVEVAKILGISVAMAAALLADFGYGGPVSKALERQYANQANIRRASQEDRNEYKDLLKPGGGVQNYNQDGNENDF